MLPKTYDFKSTEGRLYRWWEDNGWFRPTNDPNAPGHDPSIRPFVISIPPPNVTGELHLGHAMFVAVEDMLIRHHRMQGVPTLWVPGSDHAGIATQLQVEKELLRTEEVTREELGREKFLEKTWEWKRKYGGIIYDQLRRLGASCDWSRERFTLDEGLSRAVREAFVRLYRKGLIYRGPRLINWSPGLKTAVSDLEVEYSEEPGALYYFKYRIAGSDGEYIPVATTRPETILGDTAVAVHPEDDRYGRFVGRTALVPILDRPIPVIADEAVDREFATGALKVTPGHDPTDYEIGARHGLPIVSVLDREAKVTEAGGPYRGLDRFEARRRLWSDMQAAGLVLKVEPYTLNVPRSQRGGEIVEPMVSTQWFVQIEPLADAALEAVREGRVRIIPERFEKVYYNWLENIRDWCISRQLWWGHRIPVWYAPDGTQFCAHSEAEAYEQARRQFGPNVTLEQDPDVLDTWFSSGLWPFSTLGWPDETPDHKYFYPTSVLETGYDILFFWVARMIMFGLEFAGQPPFHTVYLHGLVRDGEGRKMSKSLGNVIDPREVMDEFGTDALRFTLLTGSTPGNDMNLSLQRVEANRNFANKLWNAARFVISNLDRLPAGRHTGRPISEGAPDPGRHAGRPLPEAAPDPGRHTGGPLPEAAPDPGQHAGRPLPEGARPTLADRWIEARLRQVTADVNRLFEAWQYGEGGRQVYEFFWSEFADWYIEIAKLQLAGSAESAWGTGARLVRVLDGCLRLLHPFTPFVTEEIWQHLRRACQRTGIEALDGAWSEALIIAHWPEARAASADDQAAIADFGHLMDIVRAIRNARAEKALPPSARLAATIAAGSRTEMLQAQREVIASLARLEPLQFRIVDRLPEKILNAVGLVIGATEVFLPRTALADPRAEGERIRKELAALDAQIGKAEALLASEFARKAPAAVVEKERAKLQSLKEARDKLAAQI